MLSSNKKHIKIASMKGYVISKTGVVTSPWGKKLKLMLSTRGYLFFSVSFNERGRRNIKSVDVHQYQAYKKYGNEYLLGVLQARHLDGNPKHNYWNNIELGTNQQNQLDIPPEQRRARSIPSTKYTRRFTDQEVRSIIEDHKRGISYNQLCKKYDTSKGTLSYLFNQSLYAQNI